MLKAHLLFSKELDYPSGSALNYYNGQLYLTGDDAGDLIILDTEFNILRSVPLFPGIKGRIEKAIKADIEAGDFVKENGADCLWLFGSGSLKPYRDSLLKYDPATNNVTTSDLSMIYKRIEKQEIGMLNIEAAAFIKDNWLLGSRSNRVQKQNYLIALPRNFTDDQDKTPINLIRINPPTDAAGISGMDYHKDRDLLFLTFSLEETPNAYDDGERGDSFLAVINDISHKLREDTLNMDSWLHLPAVDACFDKMKVESVTSEGQTLFLVADNDDGKTVLYKLRIEFL